MVRVILFVALFAEAGFLIGMRLWLKSMPEGFIQGFGAGAVMMTVLGAIAETFQRKGY